MSNALLKFVLAIPRSERSVFKVPVVLTCGHSLRETVKEAMVEFGLVQEDPADYGFCLNYDALTVKLSPSAFADLPTSGRPPQLRLISMQDLKQLSLSQKEQWSHNYLEQPLSLMPQPESSQSTPTTAITTQPKKRGRKPKPKPVPDSQPADPAKLWLAGGPGQGSDNDNSQRYRKRRMVLGQPNKNLRRHSHPAPTSHTPDSPGEGEEEYDAPPLKKQRTTVSKRPRRSAADLAIVAISQDAANNGVASPSTAHTIDSAVPKAYSQTTQHNWPSTDPQEAWIDTAHARKKKPTTTGQSASQIAQQAQLLEPDTNATVALMPVNSEQEDTSLPLLLDVPLPDPLVTRIESRSEPHRSKHWISFCFEQRENSWVAQREVWQACECRVFAVIQMRLAEHKPCLQIKGTHLSMDLARTKVYILRI